MTARVLAGRVRASFDTDRLAVFALAAAVVVPLLLFVALPLVAILRLSFVTPGGGIGLANYATAFASPKFTRIAGNSLLVSATTTLISARDSSLFMGGLLYAALLPAFSPKLSQASRVSCGGNRPRGGI